MIDAESYGVSGRQLRSSKQTPASGRVCSCRKPSVWPSSWPRMFPGGQPGVVTSDTGLTRMLRLASGLLGKKARAMNCVALVGCTGKTTAWFLTVHVASADLTWMKSMAEEALSQSAVPCAAARTTEAFRLPNVSLTQ